MHVPVTLQVRGRVDKEWWVDLLARTSYVDSEQKTPRRSGQVSTMTDTSFSATLTHTPGKGPQPYVSLRVNAPTGRPVLLGSESFARMDYDLVGIPSFGEGWNFGPSAGVGVPLSKAVRLSLGGGYTERGAYDREGAINRTTGVQAPEPLRRGRQHQPRCLAVVAGRGAIGVGRAQRLARHRQPLQPHPLLPQRRHDHRFRGGLGGLVRAMVVEPVGILFGHRQEPDPDRGERRAGPRGVQLEQHQLGRDALHHLAQGQGVAHRPRILYGPSQQRL